MITLRKNFGVVLFLLLSFSATAQKAPPGTVKLKPSKTEIKHATYIDDLPITVLAWLGFLYWTERTYGKEAEEYKTMLPDSVICVQAYPNGWKNPNYRNFPMVGVTYE